MESLWNKYNKIKEVFYRDFVYDSSYTEQASCIPLSSVKDGVGWVGDGTINLAQYLQFLYTEIILGNKTEDDVRNAILVLTRLADTTYDLFFNSNKGIYFKFEKGFFLRDDIHSEDADKFGLTKISSGYTNGIELKDEDPCFSPFTSQDQIWNLAPILAFLSEKGFEEAGQAGYDIFEYVIRNRHKIYNPYYSALLHHWTFLPDMDTDKVKPWDRVSNRNKNLKYLKSATKPFNGLLACTRPLITELSDKLRLKHPLLPTTSPYPIMRLETIRSIIPISCRRHPKSVWKTSA